MYACRVHVTLALTSRKVCAPLHPPSTLYVFFAFSSVTKEAQPSSSSQVNHLRSHHDDLFSTWNLSPQLLPLQNHFIGPIMFQKIAAMRRSLVLVVTSGLV